MTADAKVGLLLGLFFIVVIAFLVNGLPNFIQKENAFPASATIIAPIGQDMVLDNSASDAVHRLYPSRSTVHAQRTTQPTQKTIVLDASLDSVPQIVIPDLVPQRHTPVVIVNAPAAVVPEVAKTPKARTHVVKSGEILPVIARHYYGEEEGNRRIVIQKLYEANTGVLKSPDRVCVGQKLTIPSLDELLTTSSGVVKAPSPSKGVLEKIAEVFKPVEKRDAASVSEYVVREGDNLWSIAQQKLGDGNRYAEIVRLNKGTIRRANDVAVGTRLKIPPQ
ncbi:MAG: LysM peptidoglycan-binding domain-containing protein [Planctomycetes bacterium]|nr:LysM peptidoglycan-binding domain-containing protein [Planctomycetota bacterium]